MKNNFRIVCAFIFLSNPNFLFAQFSSQSFAVVELFSSEGCSSCPPAEKLLSKISKDADTDHKNIFCLEYHVDYWNHGGWKDPFSKNQFTMRQNNYSSTLHHAEIYTPQMIVNGENEFVGSDAAKANGAIDKALNASGKMSLSVSVDSVANDSLYVHYASSRADKNFSLHFALVESNLTSKVGKGENSGRTLTHDNIVRVFYSVGLINDSGISGIPLRGLVLNKNCALISFVQHRQTMKIFCASKNPVDCFSKKVRE